MHDSSMSRRDAVKRFFLLSASVAAPGWVATACKKSGDAPVCTETNDLSTAETTARIQTYAYVDKAPDPTKKCSACGLFQPAGAGECGTCKTVKGPINPNGYCKSFAVKAT